MAENDRKSKLAVAPGQVIRRRRQFLGWKAVELARKSGINPRTLDAIEKGRIESPSLRNLESISRSLGISTASLFSTSEENHDLFFLGGNQKGQSLLEFPKYGFRVVCYTPFVPNFFIGKVIVQGETKIERKVLPTSGMVFVQTIMGKLCVQFDGKEQFIREGNYAVFDGTFVHSFSNPQFKETTFLIVTSPSFLSANSIYGETGEIMSKLIKGFGQTVDNLRT